MKLHTLVVFIMFVGTVTTYFFGAVFLFDAPIYQSFKPTPQQLIEWYPELKVWYYGIVVSLIIVVISAIYLIADFIIDNLKEKLKKQ